MTSNYCIKSGNKNLQNNLLKIIQTIGNNNTSISTNILSVFVAPTTTDNNNLLAHNNIRDALGLTVYPFIHPDGNDTLTPKINNQITNSTVINQDIFYNFWSNSNRVTIFTEQVKDVISNKQVGASDFPGQFNTVLNTWFTYLFDYFFCVPRNNILPDLTPFNAYRQAVENWLYFLSNNRGMASLTAKDYCVHNYLIPLTKDNPSQAGATIRNYMSGDPIVKEWCGCAVPQDNILNDGINFNFSNPFDKNKEYSLQCESICVQTNQIATGIPLIDGPSNIVLAPTRRDNEKSFIFEKVSCEATICIIDEVAVAINGYKGGGINFNQVCSGCANTKADCLCYIVGADVLDKMSNNKGGLQQPATFKQSCPNAQCYKTNPDGSFTQVQCNTTNPANTGKGDVSRFKEEGKGIFNDLQDSDIYGIDPWIIPMSTLILLIIFFLGAIFTVVYRNRVVNRTRHK